MCRLFDLLFLIAGKLRKRTISHILHAGVEKTPEKARELARKTFRQFAKLVVEIAKMDQEYRPEKIRLSGSESAIAEVFARDGKTYRGRAWYEMTARLEEFIAFAKKDAPVLSAFLEK